MINGGPIKGERAYADGRVTFGELQTELPFPVKMVVVPLVFFSLVVGIASLGDVRTLGRLGGRTLGFFMSTTVVALVIGVGLANLVKPGDMVSKADSAVLLGSFQSEASSKVANAAAAPSFADQIIGIVPSNPLAALGIVLEIVEKVLVAQALDELVLFRG